MPKKTFFKNKNNNFIETGSFAGDGIKLALDSGFKVVYSIELAEKYYNMCKQRFLKDNSVNLILGDSFVELKKLLESEKETSFTYWLDGHYSGGETGRGILDFPIMQELETILSRDINNEIIYIDDMRILKSYNNDINERKILEMVKRKKPGAFISYEDSDYSLNDIMVIEY